MFRWSNRRILHGLSESSASPLAVLDALTTLVREDPPTYEGDDNAGVNPMQVGIASKLTVRQANDFMVAWGVSR